MPDKSYSVTVSTVWYTLAWWPITAVPSDSATGCICCIAEASVKTLTIHV